MTPREAQQLQHAGSVILNNAIALALQAFFYGKHHEFLLHHLFCQSSIRRLRYPYHFLHVPSRVSPMLVPNAHLLKIRRQKDMRSRANIIMLGATLVMFAVSTSYAALDMVILIQQFMSIFIGHPDLPLATRFIVANNAVIGYEIGQTYLYTINVGRYPYLVFYYRKLIGVLREF